MRSAKYFFKRGPALLASALILLADGMGSRCLADLVVDQADIVVGYGATEAGR
jgi:hypothetical protein